MATSRTTSFILHRASLLLRGYRATFLCLSSFSSPPDTAILLQKLREIGINEAFIAQPRSSSFWHQLLEKTTLLLKEGVPLSQLNRFLQKSGHGAAPFLVNLRLQHVESVLAFFKSMRIEDQMLGQILVRQPNILTLRVDYLEKKLQFFVRSGVALEVARHMFERCPRVFLLSDNTLKERLEFWQDFGIPKTALCKMVRKYPTMLGLSLEKKIQPLITYFGTYGIEKSALCTYISHLPQCLGLSMGNLSQKMEFLHQLGFELNSKRILVAYFHFCGISSKRLQSRYCWLLSKGFSEDEVKVLLQRCPLVLAGTPENRGEKLDFFLNVLKRDKKEILSFPLCLNFSFEKRIVPRFAILAEREGKGSLTLDSPLSSILLCSDEKFREKTMCRREMDRDTSLTGGHKDL